MVNKKEKVLKDIGYEKKPKKEIDIFSRRGQLETFWEKQPFFYDKSKIFWLWDKKLKKWELSDEIDFLNSIQEILGIETINSKVRGELEAGFKQIGRKHKPKKIKKSWVQFKDKIYDVKTGKNFEATPEYFITNPIPWKVGKSEDTPIIDKYFVDWVGAGNKQSLYEFIAYSISLNKFMQRVFGFCGGGSNGKGTLIKIAYKFLGDDNCVTSELRALSEDKFEAAVVYRKLLCVMGEVSHNDLKNTNMIKKLGGEDKISFQFKGKTPFTEENTATCVSLTNSLPITPDKTIGFYRKWKIEDFPNEFPKIKEDLIEKIPDVEFENLAKKSLRILKELYSKMEFHNEGTYQERKERYEERSNPIIRFIEKFCEDSVDNNITLREFTKWCNKYLEKKHLRPHNIFAVGKVLREEGYEIGAREVFGGGRAKSVIGLKITSKSLQSLQSPLFQLETHVETNRNCGDLGDSGDLSKGIGLSNEEFEELKGDFKE